MLAFGGLKLKKRYILAPMAGISDLSFRLLNHRYGCELGFTEMINARSLGYKSKKTRSMLATHPDDSPFGIQLLAAEAAYLSRALDILEEYRFDILDFNAACPARKVIRRGEGAALMKEPRRLKDILGLIAARSAVPVTVKIRLGWDDSHINAPEVARYAEDAGVQGIFIHGRTYAQEFGGAVDYRTIAKVKKSVKIPVVASGDIFSAALARKMLDETGCDGILIARGALGNPWIFRAVDACLTGANPPPAPDSGTVAATMHEHLSLILAYEQKMAVIMFRKFFAWYTRGFRAVRRLREKAAHAKTPDQMRSVIEQFREHNPMHMTRAHISSNEG
jgi:tRNA-dihydrouridine synthase B